MLRDFRSHSSTAKRGPRQRRNPHEAERLIDSCERCNPEGAEIPFDGILDGVNRLRS